MSMFPVLLFSLYDAHSHIIAHVIACLGRELEISCSFLLENHTGAKNYVIFSSVSFQLPGVHSTCSETINRISAFIFFKSEVVWCLCHILMATLKGFQRLL